MDIYIHKISLRLLCHYEYCFITLLLHCGHVLCPTQARNKEPILSKAHDYLLHRVEHHDERSHKKIISTNTFVFVITASMLQVMVQAGRGQCAAIVPLYF